MIVWVDLRHAAAEYGLEVIEEGGHAALYSGPINVTTLESWRGRNYLYVHLPGWFTAKAYDRTNGHLEDLRNQQEIYADNWPLLAAACPLTRHLSGGSPSGLESVFFMRYYRHSEAAELDEGFDELTEIEERLVSHTPEKLWIERGPCGSTMHSALFGAIKYDLGKQHKAIEPREFEDLLEHLPEWYVRWHAGEPAPRSAFEEFFAGEFALARAEYTAAYPALAAEWRLELWSFGAGVTKFSVADYSFERMEDAAERLRGWNAYYENMRTDAK